MERSNGRGGKRRAQSGSGDRSERRGNRSRDQQGTSAARNVSRARPAGEVRPPLGDSHDDRDDRGREPRRSRSIDEESE